MTTVIERLRAVVWMAIDRAFGAEALSPEHEAFHKSLSDLERRQLETDILTTELEARVAVLEEERPHDAAG